MWKTTELSGGKQGAKWKTRGSIFLRQNMTFPHYNPSLSRPETRFSINLACVAVSFSFREEPKGSRAKALESKKLGTGERGGEERKSLLLIPYGLPNAVGPRTGIKHLGITIHGRQSSVNNDQCQLLRINFRPQFRSNMAVVHDNSFEFALQETAEVFSKSGKSVNLKPGQVAAVKSFLNGKDVLAVLPTGFGKVPFSILPVILRTVKLNFMQFSIPSKPNY